MNSLKKKKFKMPHAFTLLFIILVFFGVLSLILSWAGVKVGDTPILGAGILDWFTAIPMGIVKAIWIIVFLFSLGGFINVLIKSQALEAVIGRISTKFHKEIKEIPFELKERQPIKYYLEVFKEGVRQTWIIIPLMTFFSFAGMSYGMAEESLAFYAIIIPLALAAGFDVWTGFLIIFIGAGAGVMGSVVNPFSIGAAVDAANTNSKLTSISDGIAWRTVGWIIFTIISTIFVMVYAIRVKRDKNKSETKDLFVVHNEMFGNSKNKDVPILTKRRLVTAIIFLMTFIIMILGMLQYDGLMNSDNTYGGGPLHTLDTSKEGFAFGGQASTSWLHNSEITGHTDSTYETAWTFGGWYMGTLAAYFFIVSLILAIINKTSEENYIKTMIDGSKDMLGVALAIGIAKSIPVILQKTNMEGLFANGLSKSLSGIKTGKEILVPTLSYILYIPLTLVIPSTSGLASATFGTIGESFAGTDSNLLSGTITGYAWGAGLANMVVPTYGVVIGALAVTKIPYDKFLKSILKPLGILFFAGLIMIILGGCVAMLGGSGQKIF